MPTAEAPVAADNDDPSLQNGESVEPKAARNRRSRSQPADADLPISPLADGSADSSPADAKPKRSHKKKVTEPVTDGLAALAAANLSAGDITESTSGALQMLGMLLSSDRLNKPVMGAVIGKPEIIFDKEGLPIDSKAIRADHNARVLVKAAQGNKYIMRLLIAVNRFMSGGELAKLVGDVVIAGAVDANVMALDNQLVLMMIGNDIPREVYEQAAADAMAAAAAQVQQQEPAA